MKNERNINNIEKLELKDLYCKPCNHIKPSESCDYTAVNHEYLKEREIIFRKMLNALIDQALDSEDRWNMKSTSTNPGMVFCHVQNISAIQKATNKSWDEIKELIK